MRARRGWAGLRATVKPIETANLTVPTRRVGSVLLGVLDDGDRRDWPSGDCQFGLSGLRSRKVWVVEHHSFLIGSHQPPSR
jgi:hypothetical protein